MIDLISMMGQVNDWIKSWPSILYRSNKGCNLEKKRRKKDCPALKLCYPFYMRGRISLAILHSERPKLHRVLAVLSVIGLRFNESIYI